MLYLMSNHYHYTMIIESVIKIYLIGNLSIRRAQVMTLDSFDNELKALKIDIEASMKHTYMEKYIEKPYIDEIKLAILTKLFKQHPFVETNHKDYIVSTMLIQIASDTHELNPSVNHLTEQQAQKEKQLRVLAGDYYSGLHYLLLAKTGDFSLIRQLAQTIRRLNELKMDLYYKKHINFTELLNFQKQIHSLISVKVMKMYTDFSIQPFIEDLILINQLILEKQLLIKQQQTRLFSKIIHKERPHLLINQIKCTIDDYMYRLDKHLADPMMKSALKQLQFDQIYQRLTYKNCSFVEEG